MSYLSHNPVCVCVLSIHREQIQGLQAGKKRLLDTNNYLTHEVGRLPGYIACSVLDYVFDFTFSVPMQT